MKPPEELRGMDEFKVRKIPYRLIRNVEIDGRPAVLERAEQNLRLRCERVGVMLHYHEKLFPETPYVLELIEFPAGGGARHATLKFLEQALGEDEFVEIASRPLRESPEF